MTIKLELKTMPLSVNQTYKRGNNSFYKSREAKDAQTDMAWQARKQWKGAPLDCLVAVSLHFYWPDMRRHDIDGGLKATLDCMTEIVYLDDSQITGLTVRKSYDKDHPRVEVLISEA